MRTKTLLFCEAFFPQSVAEDIAALVRVLRTYINGTGTPGVIHPTNCVIAIEPMLDDPNGYVRMTIKHDLSENANIDAITEVISSVLANHECHERAILTWATVSVPTVVNGFGGGRAVVTKDSVHKWDSNTYIHSLKQKDVDVQRKLRPVRPMTPERAARNKASAEKVQPIVTAYAGSEKHEFEDVQDLISDLMHYLDAKFPNDANTAFGDTTPGETAHRMAMVNYSAEIYGDDLEDAQDAEDLAEHPKKREFVLIG